MTEKKNLNNHAIAVIILGYNDKKNLEDTFDSAIDQSYENYKIIYIDNSSQDGSFEFVKNKYPQIKSIQNKKNLGYAGAYKHSLDKIFQKDNFEAVVLLNSDVIVDYNWLEELVNSAFSDKKIALAQPKIFLYKKNRKTELINTFGNDIHYLGFGFCGNYKQKDVPKINHDKDIVSASGCCLLVKKNAYLNSSGGLDEKFFAYLEDQDLSWRLKMNDYKIILSAKSIIWHKYVFKKNERNNWKFFTLERNRLFFIFKNYQTKTILLLLPVFIFMEIGIFFDALTKSYFIDKIKSYISFIKNIKELKKDRKIIQQNRKLTDKQLFNELSPVINFEEINNFPLKVANVFLAFYYRIIKFII